MDKDEDPLKTYGKLLEEMEQRLDGEPAVAVIESHPDKDWLRST